MSDVSDEALTEMARDEVPFAKVMTHDELTAFAKKVRDRTAAQCVALAVDCQRDDGSAGWRCASLYFEKKLLEMFPGAAAAERPECQQ